jgi:hypothetical protein
MIKAYRTELIGMTSIVFAETTGKARYATYCAAKDAGYSIGVTIPAVVAHRAPEYDHATELGTNRTPRERICYIPEYLEKRKEV